MTKSFHFRYVFLPAIVFIAMALSGCMTTDEDQQMPWNMPQSWENNPGIPGMQTE